MRRHINAFSGQERGDLLDVSPAQAEAGALESAASDKVFGQRSSHHTS